MIVAGVVGGLFTLGSLYILLPSGDFSDKNSVAAEQVNYRTPMVVAPSLDFKEAARSAQKSVVRISAAESDAVARQRLQNQMRNNPFADFLFGFGGQNIRPQPQQGSGSGVIVSEDGYIVTNNHVIDFADVITVTLTDDREFNARVIGTDPTTDLAVLKIESQNLPAIPFGDSDEIQVGEWVLAVGNPYENLTSTVTAGIVSAKGRDLSTRNQRTIENFIQTDAVVNPGNSGGALVDVDGKLIGINTMIYTRTGSYIGYSFAIPINMMKDVYEDIIENGQSVAQPKYEPRQPRGPRLGISIMELDAEFANNQGLTFEQGLLIEKISSNGNAAMAGLQKNDIIVKVNDSRIRNGEDIIDLLDRSRKGDVLQVKVYRNGRFKTIPVRLDS